MVSIHVHDGEAAYPRTRLEITGTAASLALVSLPESSPSSAQLQIGRMELHQSRPGPAPMSTRVPLNDDEASALPVEAANVARLYQQLAADMNDSTQHAPSFRDARDLHTLIEQIPTARSAPCRQPGAASRRPGR